VKRIYSEIDSIVKNDDGTIIVTGYASSGSVDSDGETITPEAMKAAIPDYMKFGAVREMHGKNAAGTALSAEVQDDGRTLFSALIVDPIAIKKVETKTYKGFSIGGSVPPGGRDPVNKTLIKQLKLVEVSLVDRPANPDAVITMYKSDDAEKIESEETQKADEIKKNFYSLSDFANVLSRIGWLARESKDEAEFEADNSKVPSELRAWLQMGFEIFKEMAEEEMNELLRTLAPAQVAIELSEKGDVEKVGAKFSAAHKSFLAEVHKMAVDMCGKFDGIGYKDAEETEEEKADEPDITKSEEAADMKKFDEVSKALESAKDDLEKAQARIKELESQPETPKVVLKGVAVDKSQDVTEKAEPETCPFEKGTAEAAEWQIKKIHQNAFQK
jgi:phage head maturation protease